MASTSSAVECFFICSKISAALSLVSIQRRPRARSPKNGERRTGRPFASRPLICGPHFDLGKSRRGGAVARAHDLLRLSFSAVRRAPQNPLIAGADGIHRVPEFCSNSAVRRVLQQAGPFAVFDFPSGFAAELEVVTLV